MTTPAFTLLMAADDDSAAVPVVTGMVAHVTDAAAPRNEVSAPRRLLIVEADMSRTAARGRHHREKGCIERIVRWQWPSTTAWSA